ncbi:MAG TPA: SDR family oxidoreductase [Flavisolibacter sp.]|jgi:NAD(P)-dependent dehydrogenase (short-subunit alcohol dehydrogenase family)|nr:SDR family oxidoreductase [Flavisolibacter sp.]
MQDKVVIITGASKGIGRQTALNFAESGYQTVVVATNEEKLLLLKKEIQETYSMECQVCYGDLSDLNFVDTIVPLTLNHFGRIDTLVNNAAWRSIETMRTINVETWERTLRICLTAPAFLAQSCARHMEEAKHEGCIINVSSVMSQKASGSSPAYIACKGAMESLTRELAVTYGRSGIRAVCVRPGYIDTDMSSDYQSEEGDNISSQMITELLDFIPFHRGGSVVDVANAIVWLASEQARYLTGCDLTIDGGLTSNFNSYSIKKRQFPTQY